MFGYWEVNQSFSDGWPNVLKPLSRKRRKPPARFTQATAARVLAVLAEGGSVQDACRALRLGRHGRKTVYRWLKGYPEFEEAAAEARKIGALAQAERSIEVANELLRRARAGELKRGEVAATHEWLGHIRYLLARHNPERYGSDARQAPVAVSIETTLNLNTPDKPERDPFTITIEKDDE